MNIDCCNTSDSGVASRPLSDWRDDLAGRVSALTTLRRDEPLAARTTMRVGGPADLLVEPASEADLAVVLKLCAERRLPWFVLGRGSNLLIRDGGIRGVVLSLGHTAFAGIKVEGSLLRCGAGARLKNVVHEARRHHLAGLEFMEGIPGSVGGALRMNAGAMGSQTFEVVESVRLMGADGVARDLPGRDIPVRYRECPLLRKEIALGAVFRATPAEQLEIERRMKSFSQKRWSSQPAAPSAGCVFKNPDLIPAGRLIDELGLKGTCVGGARVSLEHGNFIVNDGNATARDVLELIELLRARVREARGVELETEVQIVGE